MYISNTMFLFAYLSYVSDMLNTRLSPAFVVLLLDTTDSYDDGRVE